MILFIIADCIYVGTTCWSLLFISYFAFSANLLNSNGLGQSSSHTYLSFYSECQEETVQRNEVQRDGYRTCKSIAYIFIHIVKNLKYCKAQHFRVASSCFSLYAKALKVYVCTMYAQQSRCYKLYFIAKVIQYKIKSSK